MNWYLFWGHIFSPTECAGLLREINFLQNCLPTCGIFHLKVQTKASNTKFSELVLKKPLSLVQWTGHQSWWPPPTLKCSVDRKIQVCWQGSNIKVLAFQGIWKHWMVELTRQIPDLDGSFNMEIISFLKRLSEKTSEPFHLDLERPVTDFENRVWKLRVRNAGSGQKGTF